MNFVEGTVNGHYNGGKMIVVSNVMHASLQQKQSLPKFIRINQVLR